MPQYGNRSQGHQPVTAETDESHTPKTQRAIRKSKQSAGQNVASAELLLKISSENSDQRNYRTSENISEPEPASTNRKSARLKSFISTGDEIDVVDSISAVHESPEMNSQQLPPASDTDEHGDEELPLQFQSPGRTVSGPEPHAEADAHSLTYCDCGADLHHVTATEESPGIIKKFTSFIFPHAKLSPAKSDLEPQQQRHHRSSQGEQSPQRLQVKGSTSKQIAREESDEVAKLKRQFTQTLKAKEQSWKTKEIELQGYIEQMQSHIEQMNGELARCTHKIQEIESEKQTVQEQHNSFIRKQQEESFRQMTSARWAPVEERKVMGDLDRLKREMRSWAKGTSMNNMALLQSLDERDYVALMNDLAHVVLFENEQLPQGLSTSKSPALLLNALLAHSVYTSIFRNPFFFLEDGLGDILPRPGLERKLDEIYQRTQQSNQEDAYIWRSQTLRLLLPPLRNDTSNEETELRSWTEELVAKVASRQASNFLRGAARHLINEEAKANCGDKLQAIYREAGTVSYMLWTRRTTMRCYTLHEMGRPLFNPDSQRLAPHTSVKYDNHEDQLKGKPISVLVHPLLEVYGTDDAKDYDQGRIWASAEVWLDSRKSPAS